MNGKMTIQDHTFTWTALSHGDRAFWSVSYNGDVFAGGGCGPKVTDVTKSIRAACEEQCRLMVN